MNRQLDFLSNKWNSASTAVSCHIAFNEQANRKWVREESLALSKHELLFTAGIALMSVQSVAVAVAIPSYSRQAREAVRAHESACTVMRC